MKLEKFTNEEIIAILEASRSFRSGAEALGYSTNGSAGCKQAKKELARRGIDLTTISYQGKGNSGLQAVQLTENSPSARIVVRRYILRLELIPVVCAVCGITDTWNGQPISLQLEHRNGISDDHRLENLEWLCPNCHSQTKSFAGRNKKQHAL